MIKLRIFVLLLLFYPVLTKPSLKSNIQELLFSAEKQLYNNPKQASYYAYQALQLIERNAQLNTDKEKMSEIIYTYAYSEQLLGNFDTSIKYLYDGIKSIPTTNRTLTAKYKLLMGRVYGKLGDFNKAIELNDSAISIFKSLGDSINISNCYNERGVIYHLSNHSELANKFLSKSLAINRAQRNIQGIASNLNNFCLYEGDCQKKLTLIQEAITINKNLDATWALGENYNNMGKQYFYCGQYDKALYALKIAYNYATKITARELICDNYEYLSWVYEATGNHQKAYECLKNMHLLIQQLQGSAKLRSLEREVSEKKLQEKQYESEVNVRNYRIKLLNRNLWLVSSLSIIMLLIISFIYWTYKRKEKISQVEAKLKAQEEETLYNAIQLDVQEQKLSSVQTELKSTQKEVDDLAVFISAQNEFLDNIKEQLKKGYKMEQSALLVHLKKINSFINQYQQGDSMIEYLLQRVEIRSNDFLKRLLQKHPNLTTGEKHLAIFLRVNLSTKNIAMLTGATPKTIHMNKYRLKKALGLDTDTNIVTYLQNI